MSNIDLRMGQAIASSQLEIVALHKRLAAFEARAKWAEDVARPALNETLTIAIAQDGAKGLKMRAVLRKTIDAYPQPEQETSA